MKKLTFAVLLSLASLSAAQAQAPSSNERVTVMNLDDNETIEGTPAGPDIESVDAANGPQHTSLIRVRGDFAAEAMSSVGDL